MTIQEIKNDILKLYSGDEFLYFIRDLRNFKDIDELKSKLNSFKEHYKNNKIIYQKIRELEVSWLDDEKLSIEEILSFYTDFNPYQYNLIDIDFLVEKYHKKFKDLDKKELENYIRSQIVKRYL